MKISNLIVMIFLGLIGSAPAMQSPSTERLKVLFFRGMSTLGKGDICREVIKQDSRWRIVNDDDCTIEVELAHCKEEFPDEYRTIEDAIASENIFPAIKRSEFCYKPEIQEDKKLAAKNAITSIQKTKNQPGVYKKQEVKQKIKNLIKNRIRTLLQHQYHVVNDSWMLDENDFQEFSQNYQVIKAYWYMPLNVMINTLIDTNTQAIKTGNLKNKRFFWHILNAFERVLLAQQKGPLLEIVSQDELLRNLRCIERHIPENKSDMLPFTYREISVQELAERREKYLAWFGQEKHTLIWPDLSYDIIIEKLSTVDDSNQKASQLLQQLKER